MSEEKIPSCSAHRQRLNYICSSFITRSMYFRSLISGSEAIPSRRSARRDRMRTAVLAAVACASMSGFLPGADGLQTGGINSIHRCSNAGATTSTRYGSASSTSNRRHRREMNEDTFATQRVSRRGGPLYVGDFLKGDLYPG